MGCVGWWVVWVGKEVVGGSAMKGSVTKHSTRSVANERWERGCEVCIIMGVEVKRSVCGVDGS